TKGELVRALELGSRAAGRHTDRESAAHWDGRNAHGEAVASGAYIYTLRAGSVVRHGRMVVVK
ncbi:MAG: FlgD immunoglobulin-like domain containing protein, partial [Candidatus Poribacteria bacterium]